MFIFVPYAGLIFGALLYLVGSVVWDYGAASCDEDHHVGGTERDIKLGMIGAVMGLIVVALSLWGIGAHLYELYKYYLG